MGGDWFSNVLFWVLWSSAMTLVMGYLTRARLRRPIDLKAGELRHPWTTLALGLIGILLFGGLGLVAVFADTHEFGGQQQHIGLVACFFGIAMLFILVIVEYRRGRHYVTEDGIQFQPLMRRGGLLKWSDVRPVRYSQGNKWFRLDGASGEVVRVSAMLLGLPEFACSLLERVSPESIEPSTLPVLVATREGRPPSIW